MTELFGTSYCGTWRVKGSARDESQAAPQVPPLLVGLAQLQLGMPGAFQADRRCDQERTGRGPCTFTRRKQMRTYLVIASGFLWLWPAGGVGIAMLGALLLRELAAWTLLPTAGLRRSDGPTGYSCTGARSILCLGSLTPWQQRRLGLARSCRLLPPH